MDAERWERATEILAEAIDLPPSERAALLDARCADDEALRAELEGLIRAAEADDARVPPEPAAGPFPPPDGPDPGLFEPDLVGETIGPHRVEALVGVGGMGRVYKGVDTVLGRDVALKVLNRGGVEQGTSRVQREARVLASLNHPNIGGIYGVETYDGRLVLVLEYVEGRTLSDRLGQGPLTLAEALPIARQIADALVAAHARGIVHRDLKPANVVRTSEGVVKVLDFGIAKPVAAAGWDPGRGALPLLPDATHTVGGAIIGTPAYMSPEQIRGAQVDPRTDVWAFGVVLFQMLADALPFPGDNPEARMTRVLADDPDWQALPATVPSRIRTLLERCLAKDPNDRIASMDAVRALLADEARRMERPRATRTLGLAGATLLVVALAVWAARALPGAPSTGSGSPRVLILPFAFLGEAEDAYLAEGLSEEISDRLSGHAALTVLGRQTAVYASTQQMGLDRIADELGADYVLDGTVRLRPGAEDTARVRVRVALTSTASLSEVWSETWEGAADDVFDVQAEVAARVADALGFELPGARLAAGGGTPDLEAYDYYLRGNEYSRRSELEPSMRSALALYERAVELDPQFAAAWAAVSVMRTRMRWRAYDPSPQNLLAAREAGERALQLNPEEAYGHLALGYFHYYGFRDYEPALQHFTAAERLRPNDPETRYAVGLVARRRGQWDLALTALEAALAADPRHAEVATSLAETYIALGRYAEAQRYLDRAVGIAPDRPGVYLFHTWLALITQPGTDAAAAALARGWDAVGGPPLFGLTGRYLSQIDWWIPHVLATQPDFQRRFESVDLLALAVDSVAAYLHRAEYRRGRGDTARARVLYDSARVVLEARVAADRRTDPDGLSTVERGARSARLAHLAVIYEGLGRDAEARAVAEEAVAATPVGFDALHGSEAQIQRGLVLARLGDPQAAAELSAVFASPSPFRPDLLRHDPGVWGVVAGR